ncbi:MAG: Ig-like domain-containing protein [Deltaproteobacteria bacterium]|nr:Ig-like domain-containing protein [Deltaproteobacteria bacterium]
MFAKMARLAKRGRCMGLLALALAWGWPAWGAVLLDEGFDTPAAETYPGLLVDTGDGRGWRSNLLGEDETKADYLKFKASNHLRPEGGTLEIELVRDNKADAEALFALVDGAGTPRVVATLRWSGFLQHQVPELQFGRDGRVGPLWYVDVSDPVKHGSARVTAESIPFPKAVGVGQRFHLAFTWGGRAEECNIYLDGEKLSTLKDMPFGMEESVRRATWLVFGGEPIPGTTGAGNQLHSIVRRVRVHDVALDGRTLYTTTLHIGSVAAAASLYGAGQEIIVALRGTADKTAAFTVAGVAADVPMDEVDDGVYVGKTGVPAGLNLAKAALTGTLTDPATSKRVVLVGAPLGVDTAPPEPVGRILAVASWPGELTVSWEPSPSADVAGYRVYRGEGRDPGTLAAPYASLKATEFVDTRVIAGIEYRYAVESVDRAGNGSPGSPIVEAKALPGDGPRISSVAIDPAAKPARPGQVVTIAAAGQSGGQMTADLEGLGAGIGLAEEGRTGRYAGSFTVKDADVGATKSLHRVLVHLTDAFGTSDQAGPEFAVVGQDTLDDKTPPVITQASHDGFKVAGFSGRLVAGDQVTVTLKGEPAGYASFELSEVPGRVAMKEVDPGSYAGSFVVPWGAQGTAVPVTVYLADEAGNETAGQAEAPLAFNTRVRLTVGAKDGLLPADKKSQTKLTVKATNANGKVIEGHELELTLSTTEEYTGVVGGGDVEWRLASMDDVDNVEVRWGGATDNFGEVSATYTAGFAAKTALLVAKDLTTGNVGAGWLNTYVASTVAIELIPRTQKGAQDRAVLRISADPAKLTADGRSTSRIKVWLTDLSGSPVVGAKVAFTLGNENGRLKLLQATTDPKGVAEAEYRAGTSIGTVTVTASAAEYGVTGMVQIVLLADAPAKIDLVASTAKLVANGSDQATLSIRVSDIHDNPNDNVPVTFAVLRGSGKVSAPVLITDRYGEGAVVFTAGTGPGTAIVEARHTSRAPTEDELRRVYGTVFVPRLFDRQERDRVILVDWLVRAGDKVEKGQTLATLETRTGNVNLLAPAKGVFVREVKHERDRVELGDTVGYVEIDPGVWRDEYAK